MPRKKATITPAKIIESELKKLGDKIEKETTAAVRVSKDRFDKDGNITHRGGSLRDSILPYAKGKKLTLSQLYYGKWQKPKELGTSPWSPPPYENPMLDSIKKNLPDSISVIAKDLLKNIVSK